MERFASAMWKGGLKDGKGVVSSASGALSNAAYGFTTRFENAKGTNPEELVAAAHAGCFSMALSGELGKLGFTPDSIETKAKLNFDKTDAGWTVTSIHLDVVGKVPKADAATFTKAAEAAKKGCPISRLLNTTITMSARLS
ncbi:MAG: OsmC family protein [Methanobacteriota archaeon]|nr:MAG: OsmC family protein [Euryarchaeota archaeon]